MEGRTVKARPSFQIRIWYLYQFVMWPIAALDGISHPVQHHDAEHGKGDPYQEELRAYLPQQVTRHGGIIPDTEPQPDIQDDSGGELHNGDTAGADRSLKQQ